MTLHASQGSHGPSELVRLQRENEKMREALKVCREYVRTVRGAWWNDRAICDLMTKHINPALGLDPWAGG